MVEKKEMKILTYVMLTVHLLVGLALLVYAWLSMNPVFNIKTALLILSSWWGMEATVSALRLMFFHSDEIAEEATKRLNEEKGKDDDESI